MFKNTKAPEKIKKHNEEAIKKFKEDREKERM